MENTKTSLALTILLPGSIHHLLEYETARQRHVIPMMATIDALSRLYGTTFTPVVLARTLGLQATNALKPVKVHAQTHGRIRDFQ